MTPPQITIRPQMIKDAAIFYRILNYGNFPFFPVNVPSIEAEKRFLRGNCKEWRSGRAWHFSILLDGQLIGAVGIMPESGRSYNAEIGYFLAREQHGKGYAVQAVKLAWQYVTDHLPQIRRLQALIAVDNHPSVKVVEKAGFQREGRLQSYLKCGDVYYDAYIYARIIR